MKYKTTTAGARGGAGFPYMRAFACTILCIVMLCAPFVINKAGTNAKKRVQARTNALESMYPTMNRLYQLGRKMQYAGADIENDLMENLKKYAYALNEMNLMCAAVFENGYAPVDLSYMRHLMHAVSELEQKYLLGDNAEKSEKTVISYLMQLGVYLSDK